MFSRVAFIVLPSLVSYDVCCCVARLQPRAPCARALGLHLRGSLRTLIFGRLGYLLHLNIPRIMFRRMAGPTCENRGGNRRENICSAVLLESEWLRYGTSENLYSLAPQKAIADRRHEFPEDHCRLTQRGCWHATAFAR